MWDKGYYIRDTVHEGKIYYIEIKKKYNNYKWSVL